MDDFSTFARDFGLRPQGKAAPMSQSRSSTAGSYGGDRPPLFDDVFGGPPKYSNSKSTSSFPDFDYDSIFKTSSSDNNKKSDIKSMSSPVYDKPVYDEDVDIFDGLPGVKSKSTSDRVSYDENIFATMSNQNEKQNQNRNENQGAAFDDLLGNLGRSEKSESKSSKSSKGFDDLLPGFGTSSPQRNSRLGSDSNQSQKNSSKPTSSVADDPFDVLKPTSAPMSSTPRVFNDPLDEIGKLANSAKTKANSSSVSGPVFDDIDPLDGFGKSAPVFPSEMNKEHASSRPGSNEDRTQSTFSSEQIRKSSFRDSSSQSQNVPDNNFQEFHQTVSDIPSVSTASGKSVGQMASPSYANAEFSEINTDVDVSPKSAAQPDSFDDVWLTVSEIPLFTQPTTAPPPSRPPPPIPGRRLKSEAGFYQPNSRKKSNDFSSSPSYSQYSQSPKSSRATVKSNMASSIDELENFSMGRARQNNDEYSDALGSDEMETNSSAAASAAAMKEAMDRAEAKFRHAKEVREREYAKTARNRESVQIEKDEQVMPDEQEREYRENEERLERERRQRDEEEKERRRLERERERAREEREKARQAVERATREARERAAVEARERAAAETRRKSERAAVERIQAEARERAERAAVQRAQAEARERAAVEAKERAERAAAEAREKANYEAYASAERASVLRAQAEARERAAVEAKEKAEKAALEAREKANAGAYEARRRAERVAVDRAAAEARQRAAAAARMNQQKNENVRMNQQQVNDNDLESIFGMSSRPSSAPRPRASPSDPTVDSLFQSKVGSEGNKRPSPANTSANIRKTSSATNIVDDLTSIFGGVASSGDFHEVEGETEERRRARLERHQRTQERAAKALAEKNQRDLQSQREQEERHRISATLDIEIRRWSAGKEGNLRALLSTLQYVLWPECGWTPVSLTDLITGASVKKVYRKATLCIHPDKVQQKGATLQQKFIAEKVFDLLKEAWNKFNSEELF